MLASASLARRRLLAEAGLRFTSIVAGIDETAVKHEARLLDATAEQTALRLARLKARQVAEAEPGAVVIGCDQILVCDGVWFDKPATLEAARLQLLTLRGRPHSLATACAAMRGGVEVWRHVVHPRLAMRQFTDAFLRTYLESEGDAVLTSVGAYRLEGMGMHLFEAIDGEYSAILGLPMMALLGFLRSCGMIAS